MSNIADKFEELGVIPVVVLNDTKDALPLAKALVEGGLPCAEVTFRTEAAEESIRLMHEAYPDMVLAAGTVLTTEQVDRAVAAGASCIRRIDSSAAAVRNVTSAQGRPPSTKALANGSASLASFNTTTGITPSSSNLSAILLIII